MKPRSGQPSGQIKDKIKRFGRFGRSLPKRLTQAGATQFGSGFLLVLEDGNSRWQNGQCRHPHNHCQTAFTHLQRWGTRYYRISKSAPRLFDTFLQNLVNWEFRNNIWEKLNFFLMSSILQSPLSFWSWFASLLFFVSPRSLRKIKRLGKSLSKSSVVYFFT